MIVDKRLITSNTKLKKTMKRGLLYMITRLLLGNGEFVIEKLRFGSSVNH
jgi:hypothetical protein